MPQKLALKRLTKSDLTLFDWHFKNHPAGNQKGTNLNANIFIDRLYPSVPEVIQEPDRDHALPLELRMFGPGLSTEYVRQRKVLGGTGGYKNYRIDGETIHNPENDPYRFNILRPGDLVIMSFRGDMYPISVSMFYLAQSAIEDADLHQAFAVLVDDSRTRSMVELSYQQVKQIVDGVNPRDVHPIYDLLWEDALEDAAQNGIEGIRRLKTRATRRAVSRDTLRRARENADRVGRQGEEFVNRYLDDQRTRGHIHNFRWIADENAVSPYDFEIDSPIGVILVDVKTTEGEFANPLHISFNELLQMREATNYDLYRVYEVIDGIAKLRIAHSLRVFAEGILTILEQLPNGVRPDSVSVSPEVLQFEPAVEIRILRDDEN